MALLGLGFRKLIAERSPISARMTNAVIAHSISRPKAYKGNVRHVPGQLLRDFHPDPTRVDCQRLRDTRVDTGVDITTG